MVLERLRLYNFRCYSELTIMPHPRFNAFIGQNGQGKTSILEAIGLLANLKSFRNARNQEMTQLGTEIASVSGEITNKDLKLQLDIRLISNRKYATVNKKPCRYLADYIGKIAAVSFSPSDLEIIRGEPQNRRVWLDKFVQIFIPEHIDLVSNYKKTLDNRNKLLKLHAEGQLQRLPDDFEIWSEQLCRLGAEVIHNRIHIVDKIVDKLASFYETISSEKAAITTRYVSTISDVVTSGQEGLFSIELLEELSRDCFKRNLSKELVLGSTVTGPHRDDLEFFLNEKFVRNYGSQGEVRSLVLAMRLAEIGYYQSIQNVVPLVLIDDFSSELDQARRQFLLEYLAQAQSQVFLSTTEELKLGKTFLVAAGMVTPQQESMKHHGNGTNGHQLEL